MDKSITYLKATLFALVLVLGSAYVSAWSAPASDPPGGSVSLPINTGNTDQNKTGSLGVWNLATAGYVKVNGYSTPGFDKGGSCTSGSEGSIRYNSDTKVMQFCDGSSWADMSGGSGSTGAECGRSLPDGKTYSYPHGTYSIPAGTFYVPNCITNITKIRIQAAGGQGSPLAFDGFVLTGGGGGSGGYREITNLTVSPGSSHSVIKTSGNTGQYCFDTTCATNGKAGSGVSGGAGGTPGGNPGGAGTFVGSSEHGGKGGDSLSGGKGGIGAVYNWPYSMTLTTSGVSGSGGGGGVVWLDGSPPVGCGDPCYTMTGYTGFSSGAGGAGFVEISY